MANISIFFQHLMRSLIPTISCEVDMTSLGYYFVIFFCIPGGASLVLWAISALRSPSEMSFFNFSNWFFCFDSSDERTATNRRRPSVSDVILSWICEYLSYDHCSKFFCINGVRTRRRVFQIRELYLAQCLFEAVPCNSIAVYSSISQFRNWGFKFFI